MERIPYRYYQSTLVHANSVIAKNLKQILLRYDNANRCKFIDYMSEWALLRPKMHIVELIRDKIDRSENNFSSFIKDDYTKALLFFNRDFATPESFMESFLGGEWGKIKEQLSQRSEEKKIYYTNLIENEIKKQSRQNTD